MSMAARRAVVLVVAALAVLAASTPVQAQDDSGSGGGTTAPGYVPPEPAGWVLVDADTGAVLAGSEIRTPQLPASTIKLFTALVAIQRLPVNDPVPISATAAGMPARRIAAGEGQVWMLEDLLYSMLTVSANDAAVAVAERVGGGSLDGWDVIAARAAAGLGLADSPDLSDPAGLDDEFSHGEGSHISPRDMAIVARAVLADPRLMEMVATEEHLFTGGDGIVHSVDRRNRLFDLYDGTIGLKTGLTEEAGRCLVAAATRGDRTMLAVMFDAPDMYASAALMLDQGFATPVTAQADLDHLPDVVEGAALDPPERVPGALATDLGVTLPAAAARTGLDNPSVAVVILLLGTLPAIAVRRRLLRR